jgi:hypothetical protein
MNAVTYDIRNVYQFFERSVWHRILPLRWLYRRMVNLGVWYIKFDGTEAMLSREAIRHAPMSYRWFGRSLTVAQIDSAYQERSEWRSIKLKIKPNDRIWPFVINPWTMAMRAGYVIVRDGKAVAVLGTTSS